jgi:hypothetical protein
VADINGVTLQAGTAPTVIYTITYTKNRPNNNQMTYNFTISAALGSSGSLLIMASRIESEIRSATLSGCPSVTDSDVKNCLPNDYRSCHLLFCFVSVFLMYGFQGTNIYTRCAIYADFFIDDSFIIN